jgi:ribonuclease P protein component
LRSARLFDQTFRAKKLGGTDRLVVYALPFSKLSTSARWPLRFGVVVSKKVHLHATVRNRLKRQVREILRCSILPRLATSSSRPWAATVVVLRPGATQATFAQIQADLCRFYSHVDCLPE